MKHCCFYNFKFQWVNFQIWIQGVVQKTPVSWKETINVNVSLSLRLYKLAFSMIKHCISGSDKSCIPISLLLQGQGKKHKIKEMVLENMNIVDGWGLNCVDPIHVSNDDFHFLLCVEQTSKFVWGLLIVMRSRQLPYPERCYWPYHREAIMAAIWSHWLWMTLNFWPTLMEQWFSHLEGAGDSQLEHRAQKRDPTEEQDSVLYRGAQT